MITSISKGVLPLPTTSWVGQVLIMDPKILSASYKQPRFQFHKITGGFGAEPGLMGRCTMAECLADKEIARWDRGDWIGLASPELIAEYIPNEIKKETHSESNVP
jgi:hypothetical protein